MKIVSDGMIARPSHGTGAAAHAGPPPYGVEVAGPGFGLEPCRVEYSELADALRVLALDTVECVGCGGAASLGMADALSVLAARFLKFDPDDPAWPDRDRLLIAAGACAPLRSALLRVTGYPGATAAPQRELPPWIDSPATTGSGCAPGGEVPSGTPGLVLAHAVGMALAERMLAARHGSGLIDHYTYVLADEACLMQGVGHEAASLAGHLRLNRLIVLFDDRRAPQTTACSDDHLEHFVSMGWSVKRVDGHDPHSIAQALDAARDGHRPTLIACCTRGEPAGRKETDGESIVERDDVATAAAERRRLGWPPAAFEIPPMIARAWRKVAERGAAARAAWNARLHALDEGERASFLNRLAGELAPPIGETLRRYAQGDTGSSMEISPGAWSRELLEALAAAQDNVFVATSGPADGTHRRLANLPALDGEDFTGRCLHLGAREQALPAVLTGIALHGGFIPVGASALATADFGRAAIRRSAALRRRVIYLMNYDTGACNEAAASLPVLPFEELAALRTIPGLIVIRPMDAVETAEAWEVALNTLHAPTVLCLSERPLPRLRSTPSETNRTARGGYVLRHARQPRHATLLATGPEVALASLAAERLEAEGINTAVVSLPCFALFAAQSADYRARVLGDAPRFAIEAGTRDGWDRWLAADDEFIDAQRCGPPSTLATAAGRSRAAEYIAAVVRWRMADRPRRAAASGGPPARA
ncbi:MAG: transketolase C-terminal domain-containing protein [Sinobacteraceae bacterium]|nr:transketolase C-terminal domain-containing protein [Nevskiaceae bacterium]